MRIEYKSVTIKIKRIFWILQHPLKLPDFATDKFIMRNELMSSQKWRSGFLPRAPFEKAKNSLVRDANFILSGAIFYSST